MCSGRVDLEFIFRAFLNGQDGVFIGGCRLGECNYITHGNYDALSNVYLGKKLLEQIGVNPDRLRIEFMSGADGNLLAEISDAFTRTVKALGPLGAAEGIDENRLSFKLEAVGKLIPYIKLVERERLRVPVKSEDAYSKFFSSDEVDRLFKENIGDKLAICQIMSLLKEKPFSTAEIADTLDLKPSEVSRHMKTSSRNGFVMYDVDRKCYRHAVT